MYGNAICDTSFCNVMTNIYAEKGLKIFISQSVVYSFSMHK